MTDHTYTVLTSKDGRPTSIEFVGTAPCHPMNPRGDICLVYFDGPLAHLEGVWYWNEQRECVLQAPEDIHDYYRLDDVCSGCSRAHRNAVAAENRRMERLMRAGYSGDMSWEEVRNLWVNEQVATEDFIEREGRYRCLIRPGPLSGPNPFYKFWALRRRIRPLFANTWGSA